MKRRMAAVILLTGVLIIGGCGANTAGTEKTDEGEGADTTQVVDTSDMFTERDMEIGYDEETAALITLSEEGSTCDSDAVEIADGTITITDEGTYILSGTLEDGMVIVDAEDTDKVQVVLNGVDITKSDSAAIYVRTADKVFLTTVSGTENTLSNGGTYTAIDDNNIDSVIFSKSDLTLNGAGSLTIEAEQGHGVVSKDDLVLTGGTYSISAAEHGLSGKDSVRIAEGTYSIVSGTDGIHSENADDAAKGFVYMAGGSVRITAGDDGIHASSSLTICGGTLNILQSYEGLEGLTIDISGGNISVKASDDGLNAAGGTDSSGYGNPGESAIEGTGSDMTAGGRNLNGGMGGNPGGGDMFAATEGAYIHISGGKLEVDAAGDGIDSNGDFTVSGGETCVSGPTDSGNGVLDYAGEASISGGVFMAAGSAGMALNFGSSSTQGAIMLTVNSGTAGSEVSLSDSEGNELVSWRPAKTFSCVIVSCPEIVQGSSYSLTAGGNTEEVTMDSLIYGAGSGMGGRGDMGDRGNIGAGGGMGGGRGADGSLEIPEGMGNPGEQEIPEGMGTPGEQEISQL